MVVRRSFSLPTKCASSCILIPGDRETLERQARACLPVVTLHELRERRFSKGVACPHCDGTRLHRHGKYRGRQRYKCLSCKRTFTDRTNTPMSGTHYPEKWSAYVLCMSLGYSLRKTAQIVGISLPTAFNWRHKILSAFRVGHSPPAIEGVVEMDEVYVLESQKGSRTLSRPPRKRGTGRSMTRGPAFDRACVLVVHDRREQAAASVVGMGALHVFWLEKFLQQVACTPTFLCTDNRQAYWSLALRHGLPRIVFQQRFKRRGIYHFRNVDRFLGRFKDWLLRFNGVATKFLENYVHWFLHYNQATAGGLCPYQFSRRLLLQGFDEPVEVRNDQLFPVAM